MNLADELRALRPSTKRLVYDLAAEAGFDVTDWLTSATNPRKAKANPKYCYEWSFVEPGKVVIFNLWHDIMKELDGEIVYQENFRDNAAFHRANGGKSQWIARGDKLDAAVAAAANEKLPVRVIILHGDRRNTEDPNSESSRVKFRQLDQSEWYVREYNPANGAFILARGVGETKFADQFDLIDPATVRRTEVTSAVFMRNPEIRRRVLRRANGQCEFCGEPGFRMANGKVYLETHHITRLADGGSDTVENVIALCPNHHKEAHFAIGRDEMKIKLNKLAQQHS